MANMRVDRPKQVYVLFIDLMGFAAAIEVLGQEELAALADRCCTIPQRRQRSIGLRLRYVPSESDAMRPRPCEVLSNMQRTALRAAADAERWADEPGITETT